MNKTVITVLAISALLLGATALYTSDDRHIEIDATDSKPLLELSSNPQEIRIDEPEKNSYVLSRTESGYTVTELRELTEDENDLSYPADPDQISKLVTELNTVMLRDPSSSNPERHGYYQTDESGIRVTIVDEGKTHTFYIGRQGPTFPSFFIRREEDDSVYLIKQNLKSHVSKRLNAWRDPRIVPALPDDISSITYTENGRSHTLTKTNDMWQNSAGEEIPESAVSGIITEISNIRAQDYDDTSTHTALGLSFPKSIITVEGPEGQIIIKTGRTTESQTPVITDQTDQIYLVADAVLKRLTDTLKNY